MIKTNCGSCGCDLMKRIERINPPGQADAMGYISMTKDLMAFDGMHPADEYERISKLWCPSCHLLYDHEQ